MIVFFQVVLLVVAVAVSVASFVSATGSAVF